MNDHVNEVFDSIKRSDFLPSEAADDAGLDKPITIGDGQTNSQPSTVRAMLKWLSVEPGNKVLDVGSGSGWTTALLSRLTGDDGRVVAVEIVPSLLDFGRSNCGKYGLTNVSFHQADEELGWPKDSPYDRILVSASADTLPAALLEQLAPGGRMVIPVVDEILEISKDDMGVLYRTAHQGFTFVPLMNCDD